MNRDPLKDFDIQTFYRQDRLNQRARALQQQDRESNPLGFALSFLVGMAGLCAIIAFFALFTK